MVLPAAMAVGQIKYTIDGPVPVGPTDLPTDRIISVGDLVSGVTTLHIYDNSGIDESVVGQVRVQGSSTSSATLQVKVVSQSDTFAFTGFPTSFLLPGLRNFGGVRFEHPNGDPNEILRRRSVVAVSIQGDITGDIEAGQVWRIDALRDSEDTFGGHINGNITAYEPDIIRPDGTTDLGLLTVSVVRASKGITGDITAIGVRSPSGATQQQASIGRVIVGPTDSTVGIQGDILAEDGTIGSVYTTGPIGDAEVSPQVIPKIWAGDGIGEISARSEDAVTPLDKDFTVAVESNRMMTRGTGYSWRKPRDDGVLQLIRTAGDYDGPEIRAGNIACAVPSVAGLSPPGSSCGLRGIVIGGTCRAPITIDWMVLDAMFIARSFEEQIIVGRFMEGGIVATGTPNGSGVSVGGVIERVDIGNSDLDPSMGSDYTNLGVGLCGTHTGLFIPSPNEDAWFGYGLGAVPIVPVDGVIRATDSIGVCNIRALANEYWQFSPGEFEHRTNPPRVEAPDIVSLYLGDLRSGVVWSGKLNAATFDDYYATINTVNVGCMGPHSDVWMKDWGPFNGPSRVASFSGNVLGDIHVPRVPHGKTITIGKRLGDEAQPPFTVSGNITASTRECWPPLSVVPDEFIDVSTSAEQLPRNTKFPNAIGGNGCATPLRGRVWIEQDDGLAGQIIINGEAASYSPAAQWSGEIDLGIQGSLPSLLCPVEVISRDPGPAEYKAPPYTIPSSELGGGAIGLVPYTLYATDCEPTHHSDWNYDADVLDWPDCSADILINSRFNGPVTTPSGTLPQQSATIRFYGPVYTLAPLETPVEEQPYRVFYWVSAEPRVFWADVTEAFTVTLNREPNTFEFSREVVVSHDTSTSPLTEGFYAVVFNTQERVPEVQPRYPLYCDGTSASLPPGPRGNVSGTVAYYFRLYPDCNGDGCIDADDTRCSEFTGPCPADMDDDGTFPGQTTDDAVTVEDLIYFLAAFEAGHISADLSGSLLGGEPDDAVDVNDLLFFLLHFEGGC